MQASAPPGYEGLLGRPLDRSTRRLRRVEAREEATPRCPSCFVDSARRSARRVECEGFTFRGGPFPTKRTSTAEANHGWDSLFPAFRDAQPRVIRTQLGRFIVDASKEQLRAWDDSIPLLQNEVRELCDTDPAADECTAILEYELPLESRRPDVVLLVRRAIVVLEFKGKESPTQADLD